MLREEWQRVLQSELESDYMRQLGDFLRSEIAAGKIVYPPGDRLFAALNATTPEDTKVIILGQDPYHGPGQANGLSFSVPRGMPLPPSLRNIYLALQQDLGIEPAQHGDLSQWAEQGVLLMNVTLTVEHGNAGSHQKRGWEQFTQRVIEALDQQSQPLVFMLWGRFAQQCGPLIDQKRHLVLQAPHPSPLSAHRGFFDCAHFSAANAFLAERGRQPISWRLED